MPEPRAAARKTRAVVPLAAGPPPLWPDTLPNPQLDGFAVVSPMRTEVADVLIGVTRLAVKARTAPTSFEFQCFFSQAEMEIFEGWYRDVIENHDGEFYAHWVGGSRVVAFASNYELSPLGSGWALSAIAVRTGVYTAYCDDFISTTFQNLFRADLEAADTYQADLSAVDRYVPDFSLQFIADNEC